MMPDGTGQGDWMLLLNYIPDPLGPHEEILYIHIDFTVRSRQSD